MGFDLESPTRGRVDLSGTWSYSLDEETWHRVKVPSAFDYQGRLTFVRKFNVDEGALASSVFVIHALGINQDCEIYINDYFIGKHTGGYTSFSFDIPENILQVGPENVIKVAVDNRLTARTTIPVRKQIWGWKNYGGFLRDIYIRTVPRLWIGRMRVTPVLSSTLEEGTVQVQATVSNQSFPALSADSVSRSAQRRTYAFLLQLVDNQDNTVVAESPLVPLDLKVNQDLDVETSLSVVQPRLWSPDAPRLYTIRGTILSMEGRTRVPLDVFARTTGFVSVQIEGSSLVVNRKRVKLNGVVWVEDSPTHGSSLTYEQMEKDFGLIKAMGANAVRFAFHPPHPYVIDLCNRFGLFGLEELPVWNVPGDILVADGFQVLAENAAREMVQRDRIAPSVLAWGIGDEIDSADPLTRTYVQRMMGIIKGLDQRPVYYGTRMIGNDVCADLVDLTAIHPPTHTLSSFKEALQEWKSGHRDKPMIVLGYGKPVQSGNRNGYSDPLSEESQARFFIQYYRALQESGTSGGFVDAFADWRGDRPIMTVHLGDPYLYPVGLLSEKRERRLAYDIVRQLIADQRIAALPIGRHRSSVPVAHIVAGFAVIFLVAYEFQKNRRFNETFRRALLRSYNFFADLRDVRSVSSLHSTLMAFSVSLTAGTMLSALLYHFRTSVFVDYLLTQLVVWDDVKVRLIEAIWDPVLGIVVFSLLFFVLSLIMTLFVRLAAVFVKRRVMLFHAYTVIIWGGLPVVFLSPLAMSLFKLLAAPFYVAPSLVLIALFVLWVFFRILKGISVVFDVRPVQIYLGGVVLAGGALAVLALYLDVQYALFPYLNLMLHLSQAAG